MLWKRVNARASFFRGRRSTLWCGLSPCRGRRNILWRGEAAAFAYLLPGHPTLSSTISNSEKKLQKKWTQMHSGFILAGPSYLNVWTVRFVVFILFYQKLQIWVQKSQSSSIFHKLPRIPWKFHPKRICFSRSDSAAKVPPFPKEFPLRSTFMRLKGDVLVMVQVSQEWCY